MGSPGIVEIARRVQVRRDKTTTLAQTRCWRSPRDWSGGTREWNSAGAVASVLPGRARAHESENHSRYAVCFPWMLRHCVWTVVRYQSDQRTKQTPHEKTRGCRYESALVPFGEVVMAKIADADQMSKAGKLDSAWVKAVWVGRVDRSNAHLLLTTKGCIQVQSGETHSRR